MPYPLRSSNVTIAAIPMRLLPSIKGMILNEAPTKRSTDPYDGGVVIVSSLILGTRNRGFQQAHVPQTVGPAKSLNLLFVKGLNFRNLQENPSHFASSR